MDDILEEYDMADFNIESGTEIDELGEFREEMATALKQYDLGLTMLTSSDGNIHDTAMVKVEDE